MKTYYCNNSMKFNLDSMRTHIQCVIYDMEDGLYSEVDLCGKRYNTETIYEFLDEVSDLLDKAVYGKVTGREYGRIKEIVFARQMIRYATCLNNGMSERDAAYAFTD